MKRKLTYSILTIFFTILGIIGYINKPINSPNEEILNKTFYKYDTNIGTYEEILIEEDKVNYTGNILGLNECKTYEYKKETNILNFDCGKSIKIQDDDKRKLIINMNEFNYYFYETKEETFNNEFQEHFKMTKQKYEEIAKEKLNTIKVDFNNYMELKKSEMDLYIFIKPKTCQTECDIIINRLEELISDKTIYYLDISTLSETDVLELSDNNKEIFLKEEPFIYRITNNIIKEIYEFDIRGFEVSIYNNYLN